MQLHDLRALTHSSTNRRFLAYAGKGHLQLHDLLRGKPACELHTRETVRDVKFLHNHSMFAVAQRKSNTNSNSNSNNHSMFAVA